MNENTRIESKYLKKALSLCRGEYQTGIVLGKHSLSGTGSHTGTRYRRSRLALLARLQEAGLPARVEIEASGKRVLVIAGEAGEPATENEASMIAGLLKALKGKD
jgi:hypothetical protein